jgi:TolB-like protein/Flp pilus assembly protein TadD
MIGKTLNHYRIVDRLGVGGMGEVFRAHDSELERDVALKTLPEAMAADPTRLERFKREAKTLAALNHPNIVGVYSVEESDGVHFLTMELVEGETLGDLIVKRGLSLEQIFKIALPLTEALAEAHERGIVHRDLKPGNVMMTEGGRLKVLDFGLAKALQSEGLDNPDEAPTEALTSEGMIVGTVPYMAPEQLEAKPLDARSDIFSLGILLYELATGVRPFQGDTSVSLISSILKDEPRDMSEHRGDLPRHLGRIVRHCLEKSPEERFQTARDVHNQLKALRQETGTTVQATAALAATDPSGGGRRAGMAIALVLALAVGGFGLWRTLAPEEESPAGPAASEQKANKRPVIVVLPFENLGEADDGYFADGMTEEVISRLVVLEDLAVISRSTAMQYKENRPTVAELGELLGVDYVLEGSVRWQRDADGPSQIRFTPTLIRVSDDTQMWAERYDAVLADVFEVQSDVAEEVIKQLGVALLAPDQRVTAAQRTENMEAYDYFLKGNEYLYRAREIDSPPDAHLAVQMYDRATALDPNFLLAHARTAVSHGWIYNWGADTSPERLALAHRSASRALELDPESAEAHFARGFVEWAQGENSELALQELELARAGLPGRAETYEVIAFVQKSLGRWDEALVSLQQAAELNPTSGRLRCWMGGGCLALRRFDDAEEYHDRAIDRTPDRSCPYACQVNIALNREAGLVPARDFLEQLPATLGLEETPPLDYSWVTVEIMEGRYEEALERLASGEKRAYSFMTYYIPKDLLAGDVYRMQGDVERQRQHYQVAVEMLEEAARKSPDDPRLRGALGIAYAGVGRNEEAVREAEYALELLAGNIEAALDQIERLVSLPTFFSTHYIEVDPTFDALHGEARFREILEKYRPGGQLAHL